MAVKFNTNDASFLASVGDARDFARFGGLPQAALSGRSNVGKSSLINCLLGRKSLARVSSVPGKTITVNYYTVGGKMLFVDLPGYGFAKRPAAEREKWSRLTDGFFTKNPASDSLKLVLQLIDAAVGPTPDDMMMVNYLRDAGVPRVLVLTKTDKLGSRQREELSSRMSEAGLSGETLIPFSARTGEGRDAVWRQIRSTLGV